MSVELRAARLSLVGRQGAAPRQGRGHARGVWRSLPAGEIAAEGEEGEEAFVKLRFGSLRRRERKDSGITRPSPPPVARGLGAMAEAKDCERRAYAALKRALEESGEFQL